MSEFSEWDLRQIETLIHRELSKPDSDGDDLRVKAYVRIGQLVAKQLEERARENATENIGDTASSGVHLQEFKSSPTFKLEPSSGGAQMENFLTNIRGNVIHCSVSQFAEFLQVVKFHSSEGDELNFKYEFSTKPKVDLNPGGTNYAPTPFRENILEIANRITSKDRRDEYGDCVKSFETIAAFWTIVLGCAVSRDQVALCMIGLKMSRYMHGQSIDSLIDIAGYARTIEMMR